jgi:hypothetical protein
VERADWLADGSSLMVLREVNGKDVIELPTRRRSRVRDGISDAAGHRVGTSALQEVRRPRRVPVVDLSGKKRVLTKGWISVDNLAWAPSGREIWFGSIGHGHGQATNAVSLDGDLRVVYAGVDLYVHDIASDGRVLLEQEIPHDGLYFGRFGDPAERDLSWFEGSSFSNISADGKLSRSPRGEKAEARRDGIPARNRRFSTRQARRGPGGCPSRDGVGVAFHHRSRQEVLRVPSGAGSRFHFGSRPLGRGFTVDGGG